MGSAFGTLAGPNSLNAERPVCARTSRRFGSPPAASTDPLSQGPQVSASGSSCDQNDCDGRPRPTCRPPVLLVSRNRHGLEPWRTSRPPATVTAAIAAATRGVLGG